jgi:hypothetical protein
MKDRWYKYNRGTDQEQTNNRSKLQKVYMKNSACLWLPNMQNMGKAQDKPESCWVAKCEETQGRCTSAGKRDRKIQSRFAVPVQLQVTLQQQLLLSSRRQLLLEAKHSPAVETQGVGLVHKGEPRCVIREIIEAPACLIGFTLKEQGWIKG